MRQFLQLDDGSLAPVTVSMSLEGGTLVKLADDQIAEMQAVTFPSELALPAVQVSDLKEVTVSNQPTSIDVGNFPSGFTCSNMPSTFPLSEAQGNTLNNIYSTVNTFTQGSGTVDANTLRVAVARHNPLSYTMSSVNVGSSVVDLAGESTTRKSLHIQHRSGDPVYVALGETAPTTSLYTVKLEEGDRVSFFPEDAGAQVRAICASGDAASLVVTLGNV